MESKNNIISYKDLAKLRLKDFLSASDTTYIEEGGMRICTGFGGYEQLGENYFGWKEGELNQTAEVTLDWQKNSKLPIEAAEKVLVKLQLPLRPGMRASEIIKIFGEPISDKAGRPGLRLLRFICGNPDKYILVCDVENEKGLIGLSLFRKDYYDEAET